MGKRQLGVYRKRNLVFRDRSIQRKLLESMDLGKNSSERETARGLVGGFSSARRPNGSRSGG